MLLVTSNKIFNLEEFHIFLKWSFWVTNLLSRVPRECSTSSYIKTAILGGSQSWMWSVSYLCRLPKNVNPSLNIESTSMVTDLLTKRIFSNIILSPNFKMLFVDKGGLAWSDWIETIAPIKTITTAVPI